MLTVVAGFAQYSSKTTVFHLKFNDNIMALSYAETLMNNFPESVEKI